MAISSLCQVVTSYLPPFLKWAPRKTTICDLPEECLAIIFSQTLCFSGTRDSTPVATPFFSDECLADPFFLGQVCRLWRKVTLRSSELWCSITIIHPKPCHVHRAELWMQRSGSRPVSIILRQSADPSAAEYDATAALLAIFNSCAHFWQSLELCLNGQFPHSLLPRLEGLSQMRICNLIKVNLSLHPCLPESQAQEWDVPTIHFWDLLQRIPSITSFTWDAAITGSARLNNNISYVDIKTPISMKNLSQVMHSADTLQSIIIRKLSLASWDPFHVIDRIIYPNLTVLEITAFPTDSDISGLIKSITLPSLTSLTLAHVEHDILVHVVDLIRRSRAPSMFSALGISASLNPKLWNGSIWTS